MKHLNIDSDVEIVNTHAIIWAERNIGTDYVDTMTEGIKLLMSNDYVCVVINGDTVDYLPLLRTMRCVTNIPILIMTGNFTTENEIAALERGTDLYARWHGKPEDNVASALAWVDRIGKRNTSPRKVIVCKDVILTPYQRSVFVKDTPVYLTRLEFDMLKYLMVNSGRYLTHAQILRKVWGKSYYENGNDVLWRTMSRLRIKLSEISPDCEYIKVERDIGYIFMS